MDTADIDSLPQIAATEVASFSKPEKLTYSVAEAAYILGISRPSVYRLIARRVLVPVPGLRHKRLPKTQVRRLARSETGLGLL